MKIIPRQKPSFTKRTTNLFLELLTKDRLIEGEHIKHFENKLADYIGIRHVILTSSGRLALYLILKCLNINRGDEVVLPALTSPSVPSIIVYLGATPVFIDSDPMTFNINPSLIESHLSKKTKAIIATHINGYPCNLDAIVEIASKYNLKVIEDCAQAMGSEYKGEKVGSIGDCAYFSFGLGKQINTIGGGAIVTNDDLLANDIRAILQDYKTPKRRSVIRKFFFIYFVRLFLKPALFNFLIFPFIYLSNLFAKDIVSVLFEDKGSTNHFEDRYWVKYSNFQALLGLKQLECLDEDNKKRIQNADVLTEHISSLVEIQEKINNTRPTYLYYPIVLNNRKKVKCRFLKHGIDTQESWNVSCVNLDLFKRYRHDSPAANLLEKKVLYMPVYPELDKKCLKYISGLATQILKNEDNICKR